MPTIPIVPESTADVPFAVTPSNITEAKLIAAYAEWDGTGASGNFLPCLAIYSNAGVRLGRVFPSSPVTAGDSAVVTYAPFPGGIGRASSGSGIQFDTDPQAGTWLYVETTGSNPATSLGMQFVADAPHGTIAFDVDGGSETHNLTNGAVYSLSVAAGITINDAGGGISIDETNAGGIFIGDDGGGIIIRETNDGSILIESSGDLKLSDDTLIDLSVAGSERMRADTTGVGFFNAAPVAQQPTPVTLADVIAIIRAFGLAA